jgi:DNA-binding transcriptional LysR family regulator
MRTSEHVSRRIKLRHLNILLGVIRSGSMAKAAKHLAISQPVISKAIAELEHTVGVRLVDRSPQGIEPTVYGRALAKRGAAVFNDLRASVAELDFLADPAAGELRIGSTEPMAASLLNAIVDRLSRQHPRVAFHVTLGDLPRMQEGELRDREIDLLIGRMSNATPPDDIEMKILFYERARVTVGAKNPWASRRKFKLADLLGEPWCLPPVESFPGSLIAGAFRACGLDFPKTAVTAHSIQMQIALLATGRFLTILPETMLRFSAKRLSLSVLPVDVPIEATPVAIATLKNRTQNPLSQLFIDCACSVATPLAGARSPVRPSR